MRSQSLVLAHTTQSLSSVTLTTNQSNNKDQHRQGSTTPVPYASTIPSCGQAIAQPIQMTTGGGISGNSTTSVTAQQKSATSTISSCNTIASTSSINTLSKASTISSTIRHSNGSLSTNSSNNNNSSSAVNNNKTLNTNNNNTNNNNNEGSNNQNPNWSKLQTLEQRKLELEKLLNEKNWLLQQIHKQEAQILNGNYENFNLFEAGKGGGNIMTSSLTTGSGNSNSILRRKGSASLKLNKSNVHFNGKNNRVTLSKSEYDLVQENKLNSQPSTTNPNVMSMKKRQGPPHKTNSFHDSTPASALSLTKSPSFDYNGSTTQSGGGVSLGAGSNISHSIKYSIARPHHGSSENLTNTLGVTQCDKYYLSPTSQMYADGSGFIKASQNIKQCLSPSPLHKIIALNDTEAHRTKQQQMHLTNGHSLMHHNGSQPHLDQYESVDALSLSPSATCNFDQGPHMINQHSNLWRTASNTDRSAWCDTTSYVDLDGEGGNPYHNLKPLAKKGLPTPISGSSLSSEGPSLSNFYPLGGMVVGSYSTPIEKACDEVSISSVNSESNKKPKNKQWMESSLDGPIIRPHMLQTTTSVSDVLALCPALSPTLSQNPQYPNYNVGRQITKSASATVISGKVTPSSAPNVGVNTLMVVPLVSSRPPTRTLTHHSHSHHKQSYRERTKLSSQSMSSGSYRAPKTKLDDDNSHLSHSTSYLNVDSYHHHHFHPQQPPTTLLQQHQPQQLPQSYHHNHYHMEIPNSSTFTLPNLQQLQQQQQQHQMLSKPTTSSASQHSPLAKFSPTIHPQCASSVNGEDYVGTIRYATSVATQPSRLCNPSQAITKNNMNTVQKPIPPNSLALKSGSQLSPQTSTVAATSPDIRIESPKNMTVVQQATFLPYKEVTKPFEMSDFYKYSTKFRQKEANTATMSKSST